MKKRILFIIALALAIQWGCGNRFDRENFGFTEVIFGNGRPSGIPLGHNLSDMLGGGRMITDEVGIQTLNGGVMVFATNAQNPGMKGRKSLSMAEDGANISWLIPNGNYYFAAVGYSTGTNMSGTPYCAWTTTPVSLNGGTQSISLTTTTATCNSTPFSSSGFINTLTVQECTSDTVNLTNATWNSSCASLGGTGNGGSFGSYQYAFVTHDEFGGPNPVNAAATRMLSDCCTPMSTGNCILSTSNIIPGAIDNTAMRFKGDLLMYSGSGCSGTLLGVYSLDAGMVHAGYSSSMALFPTVYKDGAAADGKAVGIYSSTTSAGKIFIRP